MKTIKYKTIKGLLSHTRQLTVEMFLNGRFYHNTKGWINFSLDEREKLYIYRMFADYCYATKKRQDKMYQSLLNNSKDNAFNSLFKCFYIQKKSKQGIFIDNSLSKDLAFDYCIRNFNKYAQ